MKTEEVVNYQENVVRHVGLDNTNFHGLDQPPLLKNNFKILTHFLFPEKAFLCYSEMYIILQIWVTLTFFKPWYFGTYLCTVLRYSLELNSLIFGIQLEFWVFKNFDQ